MSRHARQAGHGKAPSQRQLRVGEELRHALSDIVRRAAFRDPALADRTITVTEVRVSPDLRAATAFVVPLAGDPSEVVPALRRASAFLRGQLARAVRLRYLPTLAFEYDESFDAAARIERALHRPEVQRDLAAGEDGDDGAPEAPEGRGRED